MVVSTVSASDRAQRGRTRTARWSSTLVLLSRLFMVVAGGLVLYAASPPRDLWWLAPLALAPFVAVIRLRSARAGFGYGLVFGFAYLLPLLGWIRDFLGVQFGPWPWLGVVAVEALFLGLAGAGMARVSRLPLGSLWMAAVFLAAEMLRSSVPFGGFPWGRLAFTQGEGLLVPLASVGGAGLVSFAVALMGSAVAELGWRLREHNPLHVIATPLAMMLAPLLVGLALLPTIGSEANASTATVGVVQGNAPNIGLDLLYADGVLHDNHIRGAQRLVDQVRAGEMRQPDLVVLPEQVGSWGPNRKDPDLANVVAELGVPVVAGGLVQDQQSKLYNRVVRWDPVAGATDEYTKRHLVPFAETIPMRPIARMVTPFVDRFRQDMLPGNRPGVFDTGPARLGVGLCFDVAYDDVFTDAVRAGATLLAVPTNNAWYGHSEMSHQQLAMSRLRAVEHGRSVVVSATSGVSAVVLPDGTVSRQTEQFTARNLVAEVPLRSTQTLASRLGGIPSWALAMLGVGAVLFSLWPRRVSAGRSPTG